MSRTSGSRAGERLVLEERIEHDALGAQDRLGDEVRVGERGGQVAWFERALEAHALLLGREGEDAVEHGALGVGDVVREARGVGGLAQFDLEEGEVAGDGKRLGMIGAERLVVDLERFLVEWQRGGVVALRVLVARERGEALGVFGMLRTEQAAADVERALVQRPGLCIGAAAVVEHGELLERARDVGIVGGRYFLLTGGGSDEQRLGAGVVPFPHVKQAELAERGERGGMFGAKTRGADLERALEIILGVVVVAEADVEQREVVERLGHAAAFGAVGFLPHGERLGEELLRGGVVAHDPVERGEVVLRVGGDGTLRRQDFLLDGDGLLVESLREVEVATVFLERSEGVEYLRDRRGVLAEEAQADFLAAIEGLLRRFVARHVGVKPTEVEQRVGHRQRIASGMVFLQLDDAQAEFLGDVEIVEAQVGVGGVVERGDEGGNIAGGFGGLGAGFRLVDDEEIGGVRARRGRGRGQGIGGRCR